MTITWEDVKTPKDFENYILGHMRDSPTLKGLLKDVGETTGGCDICLKTGCDRYCIDIKGTYKDKKIVIDAKFYTSGKYITKEDINKLERDKNEYGAEVGFLFTFGANISDDMKADANGRNMFIIPVRNDDENPTHWILTFASHF